MCALPRPTSLPTELLVAVLLLLLAAGGSACELVLLLLLSCASLYPLLLLLGGVLLSMLLPPKQPAVGVSDQWGSTKTVAGQLCGAKMSELPLPTVSSWGCCCLWYRLLLQPCLVPGWGGKPDLTSPAAAAPDTAAGAVYNGLSGVGLFTRQPPAF